MSGKKVRRIINKNQSIRSPRKKSGDRDLALNRQLQSVDRRVSELENLASKMLQALQQIENRLAVIEGEKNHTSPIVATKSAAQIDLVAQLVESDRVNCQTDRQQLNSYYAQAQHWADRGKMLFDAIATTLQLSENKLFPECQKVKQELPLAVQEKLQERDKGLEIISRMLGRLLEPARELNETETPKRQLPSASEQELSDIFTAEGTNEESARQIIDKKLKEIGNQRYKYIAEMRELAERRRQRWLNFVEKKVLPILDGIENGQRYSQPLVNQLKDEYPNLTIKLDIWFQTYINLRVSLIQALEQVQVYPMQVKIKMPIDYTLHEPFDVQPDERLPNEYIKEIIRQGYEYSAPDRSDLRVLRPAQVVVVKN
ncbi:nucleotide exchange factor GrpE [Argonema antarcticum]|uniref:nucleotide exchange factor GrpE n=1 Tax=Argonema antarcticum TaxID=2942763 RepID=UPI002012EEE5|nr:nucleotide exchange factor GrpE [Argonema antarcticum]MCL1470077.1 nucleotide exchange factor GrpE [Argonema antarcticum A004/B2]